MNPEYLREGSGVADFDDPEKTVIGELDPRSGDPIAEIYGDLADTIFRVPIRVAEAAKYVDNAFHALKVGFANEVGAAERRVRHRLAPADGDLQGRPQAEHQRGLPDARVLLRRLVPAQGPARAGAPGQGLARRRCRSSRASCASNEAHFRRTYELLTANGRPPDRAVRPGVQARHRRAAREPVRRARRAADRQGLRPAHLRPRRSTCRASRAPTASTSRSTCPTSSSCSPRPPTRSSSTPRRASSASKHAEVRPRARRRATAG